MTKSISGVQCSSKKSRVKFVSLSGESHLLDIYDIRQVRTETGTLTHLYGVP